MKRSRRECVILILNKSEELKMREIKWKYSEGLGAVLFLLLLFGDELGLLTKERWCRTRRGHQRIRHRGRTRIDRRRTTRNGRST